VADSQTRTRDLLANERTFLAWIRTSANVMILGMAIAKFTSDHGARPVAAGAILVATGAAGVFEGTRRQRHVEAAIEAGRPIPKGTEAAAATVLVIAIFAALVLLFV
jgi:putative membrane protein